MLSDAEWNLESGVTAFYNPEDESEDSRRPSDEQQSLEPQPIPTTSSMPPPPVQPPKKKFATLGDINSSSGASGSHAGHGHSGDDSDDADENPNLYAGGEKSGLAVANPDDLKKKIVERAMKYAITLAHFPLHNDSLPVAGTWPVQAEMSPANRLRTSKAPLERWGATTRPVK